MLVVWPELKSDVPIPVQEYWNYWEEISLHNGILFKGQCIIIPKAIRPEITTQGHTSHLGIKSCLRKARAFIVLWPRTNSNIKEVIMLCAQCSVCAEFHTRNSKKPMQDSKVPHCPWSQVAMTLFTHQKKEYGRSGWLLLRLCWSSITRRHNFSNPRLVLKGTIKKFKYIEQPTSYMKSPTMGLS